MRKTKNNVKTYIITMGVHVFVLVSECDCALQRILNPFYTVYLLIVIIVMQ